jgi:hypothetical protein
VYQDEVHFQQQTSVISKWYKKGEYSGGVEHPDRLMLNTLTGEIEQAFRRN